MSDQGVANNMPYLFRCLATQTSGLDSGFRRRDKFEAPFLLVIPAEAGIQGF